MARTTKQEQRSETLRRKQVRQRKAIAARLDVTALDLSTPIRRAV